MAYSVSLKSVIQVKSTKTPSGFEMFLILNGYAILNGFLFQAGGVSLLMQVTLKH